MVSLEVKRARHSWHYFDVKLSGPDVVAERRLGRTSLRIILLEFRKTGRIQVGNVEATVPSATERTRMIEMAEAEMREEV